MSKSNIKRKYVKLHFDGAHPHWAVCDTSNPPASGYTEAVVLKNKNDNSKLTDKQKEILEYIGEEYTPVEKSSEVSTTPSSSDKTGDNTVTGNLKEKTMSDNSEIEILKRKLEIQEAMFVVSKAVSKYSLEDEDESALTGVLAKLPSEDRDVIYKALKTVVAKSQAKLEEVQKAKDSADSVAAAAAAQVKEDLSVEKGSSSEPKQEKELTEVEKAFKILEAKQTKGAK